MHKKDPAGWRGGVTARVLVWCAALVFLPSIAAFADDGEAIFSQEELDQMMAPVALYPDSLLSQILMAATYPDQVQEAAQWSKANPDQKGDDAVKAVEGKAWDPSVASLVAFPQALAMMGDKPDWVAQMGDAFLAEPEAVMDTVQGLRNKAKEAGNLESTEQQKVIVESAPSQTTIIKIEPADPQVIYVPAYNPTVVYGTWWYPSYPPFYYPPPPHYGFGNAVVAGIGFGIGIAITNSIWGGFDWHRHDVNINVNRYNNININKRLNVNQNNVSWKHNSVNRKGRPYADRASREKYGQRLDGADRRKEYRGRDAQREKAQASLANKGMDPARERAKLSGSAGDQVRDRAAQVDRQRKDDLRGKAGDRGTSNRVDRGGKVNDRGASVRPSTGDRGVSSRPDSGRQRDVSRPASAKTRDNALKGVGNGAQTRVSADRGARSSRSAARGGRSLGGGGGRSSRSSRSMGGGGGGGRSLGGRR
ncbi:MAG: DUF3300 domain-containing protein [Chromatiaceae bacterium]|nr:DUF3300 domain-containing protein [Chromatiaceae bacterium]